ncbi:Putative membrane spanning protein [Streptococcus thermophilus CNCM I-1630]|nr:Putative membrane spanning protein [Streptococcus thermophilus CNCM I-1630]
MSGFIEVFLTPEKVQNFLPKNKVLAILFGTLVGFIFPSCECGIGPHYHALFREKSALAIRLFLSWQRLLSSIQSFSLRPIWPLGTLGTT